MNNNKVQAIVEKVKELVQRGNVSARRAEGRARSA